MFLDVISTPFYLLLGGVGFIILVGIGCLVVLTMIILALFQRSSKKDEIPPEEETDTAQ